MTASKLKPVPIETLTDLATLDSETGATRADLARVAEEYQAGRTSVRAAQFTIDRERSRLSARKSRAQSADDPAVPRLAAEIKEREKEEARLLSEFETQIHSAETRRAEIQKRLQKIEGRRKTLLDALPPDLARSYESLRAQGVSDPIAFVVEGACGSCGEAVTDSADEPAPACDGCERLLLRRAPHTKSGTSGPS
jgi:predicted  nucleic acid-binding Zn-ribbon protein